MAFFIRRLISADFASLSLKTFTWGSALISSAAFGLMHGDQWRAGSVAGLLYSATSSGAGASPTLSWPTLRQTRC